MTPNSLRIFPKESAFTYSVPFPAATIDTESDLAQHQLEMKGERVWCSHNYSLAMMVLGAGKAALVPLEDVYDVTPNLSKVEDKEELLLYQKYEQEPIYEPKPVLETDGVDFRVIKDPQSVGKQLGIDMFLADLSAAGPTQEAVREVKFDLDPNQYRKCFTRNTQIQIQAQTKSARAQLEQLLKAQRILKFQ